MEDWLSLAHVKWECKYHVVFIPKYRRKVLYGKVRRQVGEILRDLCVQKGITLLEDNAVMGHVHMVLSRGRGRLLHLRLLDGGHRSC